MNKTIVAVVVIIVCLVLGAWFIFRNPITTKPEVESVKKYGPKIHVQCMDKSCGYTAEDFRAHSYDSDWPKECPKCHNKTLARCVVCNKCASYTPQILETSNGRTFYTCHNCSAKTEIFVGGESAIMKQAQPAKGGG